MEVILLERINRLGATGDIVKVRDGYARNFLIPKKKALRASEANKKVFEARRGEIEQLNAESRKAAEAVAAKLAGTTLNLTRQASQEGKLYGSVSVRDIAEVLKDAGFDVPKSQIVMLGSIKNLGEFPIRLNMHAEVTTNIMVNVVRLELDAA